MKNRYNLIFGFVIIASFLQGQDHMVVDAPVSQNPNEPTLYVSTSSDTVDANYTYSLSQNQRDSSLASSFVGIRAISTHLGYEYNPGIDSYLRRKGIGGEFIGGEAGLVARSERGVGLYAKSQYSYGIEAISDQSSALFVSNYASSLGDPALDVRAWGSNNLAASFSGDVRINSDLSVQGDQRIYSDLTVHDTIFVDDVIVENSLVVGSNSIVTNSNSFASGRAALSTGSITTAIGDNVKSTGSATIAMGSGSMASGINSIAIGSEVTASGNYATALGKKVSTNGKTGAFIIGDSNPRNEIVANVGINDQFVARFDGGYFFRTGAGSAGIVAGPNANAWSSISDERRKENFQVLDDKEVLKKLASVEYSSWNYNCQDPTRYRHYGIMAQDFYELFGNDEFGTIGNDTLVNPLDMMGVAMSAIKGAKLEIEELKKENSKLENRLLAIEELLAIKNEASIARVED